MANINLEAMKKVSIKELLKNKGISNKLLLEAFQNIPEALFSSETMRTYFHQDLKSEENLDKIDPKIITVTRILEQLQVKEENKILITGVNSVSILAALSKIYKDVYAVEKTEAYAIWTLEVLKEIGITNVHLQTGNLEDGWTEQAPFNAILIATELKEIPTTLKIQLKVGAKLLAPIGPDWTHVMLKSIERVSETEYVTKALRGKYYIPKPKTLPKTSTKVYPESEITEEIKTNSIPFKTIKDFPMDGLLERIGDANVVLLGEASHGTSEFYTTREEITKALIEKKGFNLVCAEADWPDAEHVNNYIKNRYESEDWMPFMDFPKWMWRNKEALSLMEWLKEHNTKHNNTVGFYGLDLYGLENSINLLVKNLKNIDSELSDLAKSHYSGIIPYMTKPELYGRLVKDKALVSSEKEIANMLFDLLKNKNKLNHSEAYFHAYQNATVVADAEHYYRTMHLDSTDSWNLRDAHMFYTLKSLLSYFGGKSKNESKAVVWAHNSHIGNAMGTEMYERGEINIGHLCKEHFGSKAYTIGFGTHTGTVAAANNWGEEVKIMSVNESAPGSYENLFHKTNIPNFTLPLRAEHSGEKLREVLSSPKLERAIGVIYRPKTELRSHYFKASLPLQFDEYIWFNETKAVTPLTGKTEASKHIDEHPFGLIDK